MAARLLTRIETLEYALELGPTAVAISLPICVTKDSSQFRFLSNVVGGSARSRT